MSGWPTGAWLITNAPPVTDRSVESEGEGEAEPGRFGRHPGLAGRVRDPHQTAASPHPTTGPDGTPPRLQAQRQAGRPAPANVVEASNWVNTKLPLTVNRSDDVDRRLPETCRPIWPFNADDNVIWAAAGIVTVDQFIERLARRRLVDHQRPTGHRQAQMDRTPREKLSPVASAATRTGPRCW